MDARQELTHLELAFDTKALRSLCEDEAIAVDELGNELAEKLKRRVADIRAATSVNDILVGRPCELEDTGGNLFGITLGKGYRMVFSANHIKNPRTATGVVDWSRVSRMKLLRIEKEHGE